MHNFSDLYLQHRGRIFNVCMGIVRNKEHAEDLTQEAFLKAWKKRDTFQGRSQFGTWVHRIAVNEALMELRKKKKQGPTFPLDPTMVIAPEPSAKRTSAYAALEQLPNRWRQAAQLFFIEGLTHAEIANKLGKTVGASKATINRAVQKMRRNLGETR